VVGEGANLGLTQAGRIEFALAGGRVETDAIDNSAGVDSSDHEVNIKILTGALERTGTLTRKARDKLLRSMVSEVAEHVLAHNYSQTLALSLLELDSPGELEPHARFMSQLEAEGRLDRAVEGLPDATVIAERAHAGQGLTRPELAVLLAYGKIELSRDIVECAAADDPWLERVVVEYFPKPLRKYREAIERHRLRREIIATVVANDVVNRCGPSFPSRLMAAAACDARAFVAAYEAAKVILDLPALWSATAALDGMIPAAGQMSVFRRLSANLRALTFWLARRAARDGSDAGALIARYGGASRILKPLIPAALSPLEARGVETVAQGLTEAGAPQALSQSVAALQPLTTAADLVDLAEASSWKLGAVARLYHQTGAAFAFDRLRAAVGGYRAGDYFERTAVRRMIEDLLAEQAMLTRAIMDFAGSEQAAADPSSAYAAVASWAALRREPVQAARRTLDEIEGAGGEWSFAKLTIAHAALRELAMLPAKGRKRG
jgi:glutamate dehydrogenase